MIKTADCPKNSFELEALIEAFVNPEFDGKLKKPEVNLEGKSFQERIMEKLILCDYEDRRESYELMREWGSTREEAIRNYAAHFNLPCKKCLENYGEVLRSWIFDNYSLEEINKAKSDKKMFAKLCENAHFHYLGHGEIRRFVNFFRFKEFELN